ncbi:hypothetical protein COCCADRAFT_113164 [Bipolaris zeicola 26-R-13]|uniref:Uncharacterized protein n=1 Tax=Cochliobolus carbonum (strain 26-R-13) TaxID=930089 RepID=W6XMZ3_COCC2|nr:uncharacterized protein COCCADRAFT_113164 [Bipolaris zeicola 26-R-13]EUC26863.1 hypothetical protein COCCADRAFT_113164 [Bipolaris zeicola 26-R-13]
MTISRACRAYLGLIRVHISRSCSRLPRKWGTCLFHTTSNKRQGHVGDAT